MINAITPGILIISGVFLDSVVWGIPLTLGVLWIADSSIIRAGVRTDRERRGKRDSLFAMQTDSKPGIQIHVTARWLIVIFCAFMAIATSAAFAQDRSTYATHLNASDSGIDWIAFYDQADALTAETRNSFPHHLDISYGDHAKQKFDLYLPQGKPSGPAFVFIHGGGFVEGDRSHYGYVARPLAKHGILTVVMSYRLSPEHYPVQVQDVQAVLGWVYRHIAEYGGDPSRLFVGGHSAGAILSAFVSVDSSWLVDQSLPADLIKGYVPMSGPYDLRTPGGFVDNYLPDDSKRLEASPILNIHDFSSQAIVAAGSLEQGYVESSQAFVDAIHAGGGQAELIVLEGMAHDATALSAGDEDSLLVKAMIEMMVSSASD